MIKQKKTGVLKIFRHDFIQTLFEPIKKNYQIFQSNSSLNSAFVTAASNKVDIERVSFANEEAGEKVSAWIKEKSRGLIKTDTKTDPDTRLLLASAIYFKAKWLWEFPQAIDEDFHYEDGTVKKIPTLRGEDRKFKYGKNEKYEWLAIPYKSEEAMVVMLPPKGTKLDDFIAGFDHNSFVNLMSAVSDGDNEVRGSYSFLLKKYFNVNTKDSDCF